MPPKSPTDLSKMVTQNHERLGELEKKGAVDHERISVLERYASNMSGLPATVAALGQEVKSLDLSMKREVDGLREQQKAHKFEAAENMQKGFTEISDKVEAVGQRVDGLQLFNTRQKGWWEALQITGSILLGLALIAEAVKALIH